MTDRHDGDFRIDGHPEVLADARRLVADRPWTWLRQIHGATVVEVDEPGAGAGEEADASVTATPGAVLAVQTADCAPVVLINDGAVGLVHAGWRGVVAGVVPAAVAALRRRGDGEVRAVLGPVIRPDNYEFDEPELSTVVASTGPEARATTTDGRPALDLAAAVTVSLAGAGVGRLDDLGFDTAEPDFYSHRCRGDTGRQVTTVCMEPR